MPPVYVISLKWQTALRERIKARLEALGIEHEIVDAVDGTTLDLSQYADRLDDRKIIKLRQQGLTRSEIGCYLSHYGMWQRVIADGSPYAVVLEDDALLADDFPAVIAALSSIGWYWDVVRLSATQSCTVTRVLCPIGRNRVLARYRDPVWGSVAYAITLHGARVLRDYCYLIQQPIDMAYEEWWISGLHFFAVQPSVVDFSTQHSVLDADRTAAWRETRYPLHRRAKSFLRRRFSLVQRYLWGQRNPPRRV